MKHKGRWALAIMAALLAGAGWTVTDGLGKMQNATPKGMDASQLSDGSYEGSFTYKRWSNRVRVEVADSQITDITIEQDVQGAQLTDCAQEMIVRVLDKQTTQVDTVAGSTATSKAYLLAIEDALTGR